MFGVNQNVEVIFELGLKLLDEFFLLLSIFFIPNFLDSRRHFVGDFGFCQGADGFHALHFAFA